MLFAFIAFWVLLFLGRDELGLSGILTSIAACGAIIGGSLAYGAPMLGMAGIAVLDIVLLLVAFKGDVKVR